MHPNRGEDLRGTFGLIGLDRHLIPGDFLVISGFRSDRLAG
jgi:hypothetical protein